jgi:hypothetical protein
MNIQLGYARIAHQYIRTAPRVPPACLPLLPLRTRNRAGYKGCQADKELHGMWCCWHNEMKWEKEGTKTQGCI